MAATPARDRLLAAANDLFYREGVHTVGIDRVIAEAGVAKASLYNTFGSKDELIRAYLETRHAGIVERMGRALAAYDSPRDKLLGVFGYQADLYRRPDYRGCPFVAASAEASPGSAALEATAAYRAWLRGLFTRLAEEAGAPDPAALAAQLHLLYDGVGISARIDRDPAASVAAKAAAAALIDDAIPAAA
jgi:AcrR family transcriptional regulator